MTEPVVHDSGSNNTITSVLWARCFNEKVEDQAFDRAASYSDERPSLYHPLVGLTSLWLEK